MKWIKELPKEEGWYICVVEDKKGVRVRDYVWKKDVMYGYLTFQDYADTKVYAWAEFPKWDDENWNEIPYFLDDRNWRDFCPTEDDEYIVKSISGWVPYERKAIHTQRFSKGHWRVYPNEPMNPKYSFVYGWVEFPKPFDVTDQEPIFDYQKGIGLNDKAKKSLKKFHDETNIYVVSDGKEYRELFDVEKGFVLIPKEEFINQNSNEIHEYGVKARLDRNDKDRNINAT